jgi:hypothetical protein
MTFLVLPMNFSIVEPYLGPNRQLQAVGGFTPAKPHTTKLLDDTSREFSGIRTNRAVYDMLNHNDHTVEEIMELSHQLASDLLALPNTPTFQAHCDHEVHDYATANLGDKDSHVRCLTHDDVFYPNAENSIRLAHPKVTIRSAFPSFHNKPTPLRFARHPVLATGGSHTPCTQLYITAPDVTVGPMAADQTHCHHIDTFHATPILLSGPSVAGLVVEGLTVHGHPTGVGVLFVGDDDAIDKRHKDVDVSRTSVNVTSNDTGPNKMYTVGYARAYGQRLKIACGNPPCKVIIMPVSQDTIVLPKGGMEVTNLSRYTAALGDGYLSTIYPQRLWPDVWKLWAFGISTTVIIGSWVAIWDVYGNQEKKGV